MPFSNNGAIRFKSYNNVIDTLRCIGEAHDIIKTVSVGDPWSVDLHKNTIFPLLHITPLGVVAAPGQLQFRFQLFISDLVEPHLSNEQEVLSDTLLILLDYIALLKNGAILNNSGGSHGDESRYYNTESVNLTPFTESEDNTLFGWFMELPVTIDWPYDTCNIPITETTPCLK